jgi:hypothetical protein
VSSADGDSQS